MANDDDGVDVADGTTHRMIWRPKTESFTYSFSVCPDPDPVHPSALIVDGDSDGFVHRRRSGECEEMSEMVAALSKMTLWLRAARTR